MKSGQLTEHQKKNIFFKNHAENETERLVPDLFIFSEKLYLRLKQVVCSLASIYFDSHQLGIQ